MVSSLIIININTSYFCIRHLTDCRPNSAIIEASSWLCNNLKHFLRTSLSVCVCWAAQSNRKCLIIFSLFKRLFLLKRRQVLWIAWTWTWYEGRITASGHVRKDKLSSRSINVLRSNKLVYNTCCFFAISPFYISSN